MMFCWPVWAFFLTVYLSEGSAGQTSELYLLDMSWFYSQNYDYEGAKTYVAKIESPFIVRGTFKARLDRKDFITIMPCKYPKLLEEFGESFFELTDQQKQDLFRHYTSKYNNTVLSARLSGNLDVDSSIQSGNLSEIKQVYTLHDTDSNLSINDGECVDFLAASVDAFYTDITSPQRIAYVDLLSIHALLD